MRTHRHIRSFVLRAGRVTAAQERALAELWPVYGLEFGGVPLDMESIFGRRAPRCLEIGFGVGEVIGSLAERNPHIDYLGVEVHRAGIGRLLLRAEQAALRNLRVICHDAVDVLRVAIPGESLDEVLVFFPDPWHKKRHHKRRLVDSAFVASVAAALRAGGVLRLATDWREYAVQMLDVCTRCSALKSLSEDGTYVARPEFRQPTRFERRGTRLGHGVWDLAYEKASADSVDHELHGQRGQDDAR